MSRLIDADAKIKMLLYDEMYEEEITREMTVKQALDSHTEDGCPPTIDAEPVIHCKDCKHFDGSYPMCCRFEETFEPDGYCSFGEKTDEDEISNIAKESADKISKALEKVRAKGMQKQNIKEDDEP